MRKHGWELPYHPLQVVAVAVFLALGFAFYVFFAPFVGKKVFQYVLMGIYTPLIICVFCLYIWCAAADPADPGVFKSKKYLNVVHNRKQTHVKGLTFEGGSTSSTYDANTVTVGEKSLNEGVVGMDRVEEDAANETQTGKTPHHPSCCIALLGWCPCAWICHCSSQQEESSEQQMSEDGMFFCSLCKVEVLKYSKHCRVCDKCVNSFDHHCRWINNCIGKKNYRQFVTLMVSALLLLILQWVTGILVMIYACLERKRFAVEVASKLGSSFSLAPYFVVVAVCTGLAMIAILPLAQLFFFHVLLIKKGVSTYDYIVAMREQEQQGGGQQSPQMSLASSVTGFSSASSFSTLQRGAWCTPPRMFFEDQFDVIPPDTRTSISLSGKRMSAEEPIGKKNPGAVKISPWTLARLNAEEVSKAAAQARKKSKVLQPVVRRETPLGGLGRVNSFGSSSGHMDPMAENRRRANKRGRIPVDLPLEPLAKISSKAGGTSTSMAPLQLEARSAFRTSRAMSTSGTIVASSPESSLDSPDEHPFRVSSSGAEEARGLATLSAAGDGYEASGGEDSDSVSAGLMHRTTNWGKLLFNTDNSNMAFQKPSSSSSRVGN